MSNESPASAEDVTKKIEQLQRAEEDVRRLQDELIDAAAFTRKETLAAMREAILEGLGEGEGVEASIALVPLAEVLGELEGPEVCDLLIDVLSSEEPEVRLVAGRALQDLAYDRFKEVAEATERAITRLPTDSQALRELPFVIAEVGEPGAAKILRGYLGHKDPEIVASAIEALAASGDPAGAAELRKLSRDPRTVQIEDEGAEGQVSIGALAQEALSILEGTPSPAQQAPPPPQSRGGRRR
ncbi:MAG: HEAT repeat domain-containing protein [Polyangiales bacterium]